MSDAVSTHYLADVVRQLRKLKAQSDAALAQVSDEKFFYAPDAESNSLALIVKHVAGNMRSRWTDFLTSDGEKPDRNRDSEFEVESADTRASLMARWDDGWRRMLDAISGLGADDLLKTVTVRGEPHSVIEAINRQMTHYAAHAGQIVYLAKHLAGPAWKTLSIPRGRSRDIEVAKDGGMYRPR
jgi:hypothetical protein